MDAYKLTNQKPPIGGVEYVCPSISELLDEMPKAIEGRDLYWELFISRLFISYLAGTTSVEYVYLINNTHCVEWKLPDALAEMWIWLKENNYL